MKIKTLLLFTFAILAISCKSVGNKKETKRTEAVKEVATQTVSPLQKIVDEFSKKNGNTAVVVSIQKEGKNNLYTSGYANQQTKTKVQANDLFEIGSVSKLFTAIAIMQLIEDGKLTVNTKLNTLYPSGEITKLANYKGKNYWDKITVKMLLNHTTGFIDYLNVYGSDEKALEIFNNAEKEYTFKDIVKLATDFGDANFIAGEKFAYSNTNYYILGDIISKVSGTDWRTYIENNIFKKAGLERTYFGSKLTKDQKAKLLTGYYGDNISKMPFTLAGSAGEIVSNQADLQKFLSYWSAGKLYKKPTTFKEQISLGKQDMYEGEGMPKYALGVMEFGGTVGHTGQTFGFQAYIASNLTTKTNYVLLMNNAGASSFELFTEILSVK